MGYIVIWTVIEWYEEVAYIRVAHDRTLGDRRADGRHILDP